MQTVCILTSLRDMIDKIKYLFADLKLVLKIGNDVPDLAEF
jgi:hypothetical protein